MKFYDLDLTQFVPHGIPLNSEAHVEYTGYVNEFFLKAAKKIQEQLWQFVGTLQTDYSRSCAAPNSLTAYTMCTDAQLQDKIAGLGFVYYPLNVHKVNAQFAYDLENIQFGTEQWTDAVTKYICNSENVTGTIAYNVYDEQGNWKPYCYSIIINGDIGNSINTEAIKGRLVENLEMLGTAHTTMLPPVGGGIYIIDDTAEVGAYVGACGSAYRVWDAVVEPSPVPERFCLGGILDATSDTKFYSRQYTDGIMALDITDDVTQPLYLLSKQDGGTVKFTGNFGGTSYVRYTEDGVHWLYIRSGMVRTLNKNEGAYVKMTRTTFGTSSSNCFRIALTGEFEAYNNVNSMLRETGFESLTTLPSNYCFAWLFYLSNITRAPLLPATTLTSSCYRGMFESSDLKKAPVLPASYTQATCYTRMFYGTKVNEVYMYAKSQQGNSGYGLTCSCFLTNAASSGVIHTPSNAATLPRPNSCPEGWTQLYDL